MPVAKKTAAAKKVALTSYDDLTDEVKEIMDRAVRAARKNYWCDRFDEATPAKTTVRRRTTAI